MRNSLPGLISVVTIATEIQLWNGGIIAGYHLGAKMASVYSCLKHMDKEHCFTLLVKRYSVVCWPFEQMTVHAVQWNSSIQTPEMRTLVCSLKMSPTPFHNLK